MNLEGIRRVMELEAENARLRAELDDARRRAEEAAAAAKARESALVPVKQALAPFGDAPDFLRTRHDPSEYSVHRSAGAGHAAPALGCTRHSDGSDGVPPMRVVAMRGTPGR